MIWSRFWNRTRAVSWPALSHDMQPKRRFLSSIYANVLHLAGFKKVLATFRDQILGIAQQVTMIRDHPDAAGIVHLFIGGCQGDDVAIQRRMLTLQPQHDPEPRPGIALPVPGA